MLVIANMLGCCIATNNVFHVHNTESTCEFISVKANTGPLNPSHAPLDTANDLWPPPTKARLAKRKRAARDCMYVPQPAPKSLIRSVVICGK